MKRVISISLCIAVVLLVSGCKDETKPQKTKAVKMKHAAELKATWNTLSGELRDNPEVWRQAEVVLEWHAEDYLAELKKDALQQLYRMISAPKTKISAAKEALRLFVKMNAIEVIRESLLHKNRGVVIIASEALVDQAKKGAKDKAALPYLIYILAKNNYPQEGSEDATVHAIMKRRLIEAIQQITNLDIKLNEIDEDNQQQVERVLSIACTWTKQKGIKLFEE